MSVVDSRRTGSEITQQYPHVATVLRTRHWHNFVGVFRLGARVHDQALATAGNQGATTHWRPWRPKHIYTHTIWESREAMERFRDAEPHRTAMRRLEEWNAGGTAFVAWESLETGTNWAAIKRRLAAPTTVR